MICDICGKKMPSSVLEAHKRKQHSEKVIVTVAENLTKDVPEPELIPSNREEKGWYMGEINTCQQCREEWPSKLMELHMNVRHGL